MAYATNVSALKIMRKIMNNIKKDINKAKSEFSMAFEEYFKDKKKPKTDEEEKKQMEDFMNWYNNERKQSDTGKTPSEMEKEIYGKEPNRKIKFEWDKNYKEPDELLEEADELVGKEKYEEALKCVDEKRKIYKGKNANNTNMLPGDSQGSPDESFFKDTLVFIDANFLSKLSKHFGNGSYLVYDLEKFSDELCKKQRLNNRKIFYYTAPPFQSANPTKEEENKKDGYDRFINKLIEQNILVREGRCQRVKMDGNFIFKQKAVDILLAMDLTNVPLEFPSVKRVILISSDSDFVPVIKSLESRGVKTVLYTYYEKKRDTSFSRSNHLIKSVYKYALLTKEYFLNSPLIKKKDIKENEK